MIENGTRRVDSQPGRWTRNSTRCMMARNLILGTQLKKKRTEDRGPNVIISLAPIARDSDETRVPSAPELERSEGDDRFHRGLDQCLLIGRANLHRARPNVYRAIAHLRGCRRNIEIGEVVYSFWKVGQNEGTILVSVLIARVPCRSETSGGMVNELGGSIRYGLGVARDLRFRISRKMRFLADKWCDGGG